MIVKTRKGYKVTSEDGSKDLSKDDLTYDEAKRRLEQVEYFKARVKGKKK